MWKRFVESIKQILFLTQQTEKNREEIKPLPLPTFLICRQLFCQIAIKKA